MTQSADGNPARYLGRGDGGGAAGETAGKTGGLGPGGGTGAGPVWAVVVAAGRGERFGAPKQLHSLHGARLVDHAVNDARAACDGVVVVLAPGVAWDGPPVDAAVEGGITRSESVRNGLAVVPAEAAVVVVHDAARPLAGTELFREVVDAVRAGADAAIPVTPVADTVVRVSDGRVVGVVDRRDLAAVQTPQAFRASCLRAVHASEPEATDDAGLVVIAGGHVAVVPGPSRNRKITEPEDLAVARALWPTGTVAP